MKHTRISWSRLRIVGFLLLACMIALFGLYIISGFWIPSSAGALTVLEDGWTVTKNDVLLPEDRIGYAVEGNVKKGDVYVCETTLPASTVPAATLRVYSAYSILDCYLNDTLLYTYGASHLIRNGYVPKGSHLIPLPENHASGRLRLVFTAGEPDAFTLLRAPVLGNARDVFTQWIRDSRAIIPVSVFLVLFGFLLFMLSLLVHSFDENYHVVFGGIVSMNAGLFAICYFDSFFFVTRNLWFGTMAETLCLFFLPLTLALFLRRITDDNRELQVFTLCCIVSGFFITAAVTLQMLRFYPLSRSLFWYRRLSVITCAVLVLFGIRILSRSSLQILRMRDSQVSGNQRIYLTSQATMISAVFVLLFSLLLNEIYARLAPSLFPRVNNSLANLPLLTGLVAYAALMMLSFFYHGIRVTHENSQQKMLTSLAYTDSLTGLPNRAFCYRALQSLDESNEDYCVMSLDVNYLKQTNDTRGHAAGDRLLKDFAEELRSSFRASDIIGRLGGDEFIVILKGATYDECLAKARQMSRRLPFSFSYGCAHSRERSTRYGFGIYRLADQRMYEMKQEMHRNNE